MGIKRERASERYVKQTERERHKEYKRILREREEKCLRWRKDKKRERISFFTFFKNDADFSGIPEQIKITQKCKKRDMMPRGERLFSIVFMTPL